MKIIDLPICADKKIIAAKVDGKLCELSKEIDSKASIEPVYIDSEDGVRIYERGILFVLHMALKRLDPSIEMFVFHSLSGGLYLEFSGVNLSDSFTEKVKEEMQKITAEGLPFEKIECSKANALERYQSVNLRFKDEIIKSRKKNQITMYSCGEGYHYFYGYMPPDTSYVENFKLIHYHPGMIVLYPTIYSDGEVPEFVEQPKTHAIHRESEYWGRLAGVGELSELNAIIRENRQVQLIHVIEALQEKKIAYIADQIAESKKRIILISGPSSSGKTTFSNRLRIQLQALNLQPVRISLDDYFVDRDRTPLDENGEYNFESIDALDLDLLNEQLNQLLEGREVEIPKYDFKQGVCIKKSGVYVKLDPQQPVILEGIHALNENLTPKIFQKDKYKIYVSALTQLNIDRHSPISMSDNRLIRRIARDSRTRGYSASETIALWPSVRRGEHEYIFVHQEKADVMFNSALIYELAVLKKHVYPLLLEIKKTDPSYTQAKRLLNFLEYVEDIEDESYIPTTSLLREFIGGSVLD